MTRVGREARQVLLRPVRLSTGEAVSLGLVLTYDASGAVVGLGCALPPAPAVTPEQTAAALLVQAVGEKLRRRRDIGVTELRRRAEAALALLEQIEEIEAAHGEAARALLRERAA